MTATTDATSLLDLDRAHLWHPYASMTDPTPTRLVTGARGTRIRFADGADSEDGAAGTEAIDAMASWWSAIHGYRHPELDAAASAQLDSFAHVMFGGLTHEPAVHLARQLVDLTPPGLDHVFLADSGSVSVEVALKMALQFQRGSGRPRRTKMLTLRGGYHGDTFGAMSVCDPVGGMHSMFTDVLTPQVFADRPPAKGDDTTEWTRQVEGLVATHTDELAGIIVEPVLQGAGGMHVYDPACLAVLREIADRHDLLLIFDEVATGFGRTGSLFVAEAVRPDVLCLGKALTGGYLTLAATMCTPRVAAGLSRSESGVLMHGPTFMGNPLACAVASASLDLLISSDWKAQVDRIHRGLTQGLAEARALPGVVDVRTIGAVGVVELDHPVDLPAATEAALECGVWLRPFRNLVYAMPPYVSTDDDITAICAGMRAAAVAG